MRRCAVSARWAAAFLGLGFAATLALAQPPAQAALRQVVAEAGSSGFGESASPAEREGLAKLYDDGGRLLWSDGVRPTPAAQALVGELQRAPARGLDPEDYAGERLATMLARLADASPAAEDQWAIFDVTLSLAGMRLMSDLHYGRIDPASVGHNLSVERVKLDIPATLARLAGSGDASGSLDSLEPQFTHYRLLEQQLAHYRELAADPRLTVLPPLTAKSLKPGDAYAGAPLLERLLTALGDDTLAPQAAANAAAPATLTPSLDDALKRFQSRHGEKADGVLGAATMTELTRPLTERVRQIELTMERWR